MFQLQATRVEDHLSFAFTNNIVVYNEGVLFQGPWTEMNVKIDQNIYCDFNRPVYFLSESLKNWKKNGYDKRSYIQDPGFKDPINGDFSFKNLKIVKKIDFKPFDYTTYGVYGRESWKNKAKLPDHIIEAFDIFFSKESISSK